MLEKLITVSILDVDPTTNVEEVAWTGTLAELLADNPDDTSLVADVLLSAVLGEAVYVGMCRGVRAEVGDKRPCALCEVNRELWTDHIGYDSSGWLIPVSGQRHLLCKLCGAPYMPAAANDA